METYHVLNFYKFIELTELPALGQLHRNVCEKLGILGSVMLAPEGINGSLASTNRRNLEDYLHFLWSDPRFSDIRPHHSDGKTKPFEYFSIKLKKQILIFDTPEPVSVEDIKRGRRLSCEEFEKLVLEKPEDVVVLDTRNYFEVDFGAFKNAEHLGIRKFRDFPQAFLERYKDQKDKTFIMYCTGGIRCEKAVAFAEKSGFKHSFQLDGGIIRYHAERGSGAFIGNNFVFDQRWSITPTLTEGPEGAHPDRC